MTKEKCHELERHEDMITRQLEQMKAEIKALNKEKVSYKQFYWIMAAIFTVNASMFAYISSQVNILQVISTNVRLDVVETKTEISFVTKWIDGIEKAELINK